MVCGRQLVSYPAILRGYEVFVVRGATFPGIVKADDCFVEGAVLSGLEPSDFDHFDRYEDNFYVRVSTNVELIDKPGGNTPAEVYEIPSDQSKAILSTQLWSYDWFAENHYERFLASLRGYPAEQ